MVMVRRQVLVQLDDELVARLDEIAASMGTNRSELLRRGAHAVIAAVESSAADARLVAAYRRQPQDPAFVQAAAEMARRTGPEW
jgi:metal-responsive CopG/Arc/MetJ family transcriptional regulator